MPTNTKKVQSFNFHVMFQTFFTRIFSEMFPAMSTILFEQAEEQIIFEEEELRIIEEVQRMDDQEFEDAEKAIAEGNDLQK